MVADYRLVLHTLQQADSYACHNHDVYSPRPFPGLPGKHDRYDPRAPCSGG